MHNWKTAQNLRNSCQGRSQACKDHKSVVKYLLENFTGLPSVVLRNDWFISMIYLQNKSKRPVPLINGQPKK